LTYLLDTNVMSEIRKQSRDPGVAVWLESVDPIDLFLSVLVVGEIAQGIARLERRGDPRQASVFEHWLAELKQGFDRRILPISTAIAERFGRLNGTRPLPFVDGLLAATAIEHDITLVTRDTAGLADTGVRLLDPWAD
jgi:hypothetical protein